MHAFTTLRQGEGASQPPFDRFNLGTNSGDDPDAVQHNRTLLIQNAGLPAAPHWLRQVHGTGVWRFDESTARQVSGTESGDDEGRAAIPCGDASVTSTPGVVLAILTADCLPVLLCAKDGSEIGAAHAGWRGLAAGVLEHTVAAMDSAPGELIAWLGPAAGPQQYEIGAEVYEAFVVPDRRADAAFVPTRPGHWRVDLYALARMRLQTAGVAAADIHGGDLCTISDPQRFYSHRRDQRTGRMASLIWMDPAR
ncbi:peptidoglycan editing factor PgeF [Lysobacter tyrosinilyticus]